MNQNQANLRRENMKKIERKFVVVVEIKLRWTEINW